MKYQEVSNIGIYNSYYQEGYCTDFELWPTEACQKLLKGHRMVAKPRSNGVAIIAPQQNNAFFIEVAQGTVFSFYLKLADAEFYNFTDLAFLNAGTKALYSNQAIASGGSTEHELPFAALSDAEAATLRPGLFGRVDVASTAALPFSPDATYSYTINFQAKAMVWKYYIVSNLVNGQNNFTVTDESPQRAGQPISFTDVVQLDKKAPADDTAKQLNKLYPGATHLRIDSAQPLAYSEAGRKDIKLRRGEQVLVEHLPNPEAANNAIKILKFIK